jgi:hypothetical protein
MAADALYTYVFFDVLDYTNSSVLSSYTLDITPLRFVPDFTTATLLSSGNFISNKYLQWDFGDGTTSRDLTAIHTYKTPGAYNVKLSIFDNNGNVYVNLYQPTLQIFNFVEDDLMFADYGKFIYDVPASKIIDPITILRHNSFQAYKSLSGAPFTINLYASGALGSYIDFNVFQLDKWAHLRSLSRFLEKLKIGDTESFSLATAVSTKDTPIYAKIENNSLQLTNRFEPGCEFAGTTGYAEIYYVDDRTKNYTTRESPIFIFATVENRDFNDSFTFLNNIFNYVDYPPEGFQSIQYAALPIIKVRHNPASSLSITTNGIDGEGFLSGTNFNIPYISWQNTQIPFLLKLKDSDNFTTKTYPEFYSSKIEGTPALCSFDISIDLVSNNTRISDVEFFSDFNEETPRNIGAFYKGYFVPRTSSTSCRLTAGMTIVDPINFPKDSLIGWICEPDYKFLKRIFREAVYDFCQGSVSFNLSGTVEDFNTPNSPNSYCIAVAPSGSGKGNDYLSWVGDGTVDKIYKIDVFGSILSSYSLSSFPVSGSSGVVSTNLTSESLSSAAPNSIALDSKSDVWVSLFDAVSCIKINQEKGYAVSIAYPNLNNISYILSSTYDLPELSGFAGENILLPASIDTDANDNLWVAYTHPVSNFLIKYDTNGVILTAVPLPSLISPVEIVVDRDKFVWITALNNTVNPPDIRDRNDFVYKFDSSGILVSGYPISGFKLVGNITIDGDQNAYVSHSIETITKINRDTGELTNFIAGSGNNQTNYICSIGGIAGDTEEYLWVINNFDRRLYYIDLFQNLTLPLSATRFTELQFPSLPNFLTSAFTDRIFQAYGDWNGSRWINKYMVPVTVTRYVTGASAEFNIYRDTGQYNLQKQNENFDAERFYSDLRYQEILIDRNVFFNEFLGTIVGDLSAQPYELGKVVYEKISNFSSNLADTSKCNLDQLLSFCNELGVQFEQYNYPYPPQLKRIVDILSIKHKNLFGDKNTYKTDFNKLNTVNPDIGRNLGTLISPISGYIYSGVPVVAYELFSETYRLVNLNTFSPSPRPLSTFSYDWGWGLVMPKSLSGIEISKYYKFYTYNNVEENTFYNNVLDFNNVLNTISPYNSSFSEWSKDNGIMQNAISYELTKGLKLFLSAANIQYNN